MTRSNQSTEAWLLGHDAEAAANSTKTRSFNVTLNKAKPKLSDVAWVLDKLATTQGAGVPVHRALGMLADMRQGHPIGAILKDIQLQMGEGSSFGQAVRAHEKVFGSLICALVEAGEEAGTLELALRRAAANAESRLKLRRKIRGALIYPTSVVVITVALVASLLIFVVPRFEAIYASVGSDLPAMTKILVKLSEYAPAATGVLLALVLAGFLTIRQSRKSPALKRKIDTLKMRIPVTGSLVKKGVNARIASTMSSLLGAGVPLLQTINYAAAAADNLVYSDALKEVRQKVNDGLPLSEALTLADKGLFPPLFVQLAAVGETTGALPELMDKYAADAESEVENTAEALTRIIEPTMMVVIGGVVGVFLIGLYLPIIQIGNQVQ